MKSRMLSMTIFSLLLLPVALVYGGLDAQSEALLQGSISRARQTASVKPTAEMVMDKVDQAARLIAELGPAAFPRFKGADSEFIYAGTYVWVHSAKSGDMLMHPMIPSLEGQNVLFMRDRQGTRMFVDFNRTALEKGSGWVNYMWPKPGETEASLKVSYVRRVDFGNERYVVGSGVYDIALKDLPAVAGN
jgi:cytochrome c